MIVFDLLCQTGGHRFEGWFGSTAEYESQQARGLVTCPNCGSGGVVKAPMAPKVGRKGNVEQADAQPLPVKSGAMPPEAAKLMQALAVMQAEALKSSRWVGADFAEQSRAIHYGEKKAEAIHGQASPDEAKALLDEGIVIAPLPFPVAPPEETN